MRSQIRFTPIHILSKLVLLNIVGPLLRWSNVGPNACNKTKPCQGSALLHGTNFQHSYLYVTDPRSPPWFLVSPDHPISLCEGLLDPPP